MKSAGVSNENFKPPEDKNTPVLLSEEIWPYLKIVSFKFLAQKNISYTHENIVNIYIFYLMPDITHAKGSDIMRYPLFGATTYDNKAWKGYGAAFGSQTYTHKDGKDSRNLVTLGVDSSDSDNALALGRGSIKICDTTTIQAKSKLLTNCTIPNKNFVLSLYYDVANDSCLFINNLQQYKFKRKDTETKANKQFLGSISDNTKSYYSHKLNGNIYHFSVDYEPATTEEIQKIHKYLMHKHNIK